MNQEDKGVPLRVTNSSDVKNVNIAAKSDKRFDIKSLLRNKKFYIILGIILVLIIAIVVIVILKKEETPIVVEDTNQEEVLLKANLAYIDGEVLILKNNSEDWEDAEQGVTLGEGDSLKTEEDAKAVLELDNGDAVRLNADSEVKLISMNPDEVIVEQVAGESYCRVVESESKTFTISGQGVEAQALGTAYVFNSNDLEDKVSVYVYDNDVEVKAGDKDEDVEEMKKAVVDVDSGEFEIEDLSEEDFKSSFVEWNFDQDEEQGFEIFETDGPVLEVSEPADGFSTKDASVTIKGSVEDDSPLKKLIVNGEIYTAVDDSGKGFNPLDGTFEIDFTLNAGENTLSLKAYDIYWNSSEEKVLKVTKEVEVVPTEEFYITEASSPSAGKINVKWSMSGYTAPNGFKVIRSTNSTPVYPGDSAQYVSGGNTREATMTGVPVGTYNIRVCIYNGDGGCVRYTTNMKSVEVTEGVYKVKLTWTSDGDGTDYPTDMDLSVGNPFAQESIYNQNLAENEECTEKTTPKGYKVCWANTENPTYPDDTCELVDACTNSYIVTGLESGKTYHFRVGAYRDNGSCNPYSDDESVTIP